MKTTPTTEPGSQDRMVLLIDDQRRIISMNDAVERCTGLRNQDVAGRIHCFELFRCRGATAGCRLGGRCPGLQCFAAEQNVEEAAYTIHGAAGDLPVIADYRFVGPVNGDRFAVIAMQPVAPAPATGVGDRVEGAGLRVEPPHTLPRMASAPNPPSTKVSRSPAPELSKFAMTSGE